MIKIRFSSLLAILLLFSSCTNSLVYSPSVQLPVTPLSRDEGQVMLGGEMLAETRPAVTSSSTVGGANVLIRYAFNDRLMLQLKGWYALGQPSSWRSGISLSAIVPFGDLNTESVRFGGLFSAASVGSKSGTTSELSISGCGFALEGLIWIPLQQKRLTLYGGFGPAVGIRNTSYSGDGYGAIMNAGLAYKLISSFSLNLEGTAILAHDTYDNKTSFIFSPCLELGLEF